MQEEVEKELQSWEALPDETRKYWSERLDRVTPPPLLLELSTAHLRLDEFDPRALAEKVSHDAVLAGNLLAVVNSAKFGLTNPMTSVQRAVVHLGFNLVKSVIMSYMLEHSFEDPLSSSAEHIDYIRRWSAGASVLAYHWAGAVDLPDASTTATLALLARVGALVLGLADEPPTEEYRNMPDELVRLDYETARWQVTTPLLSAEQIKRWGVPEPMPSLVARQAEPFVEELPAGVENRMLSVVAASVALTARYAVSPEETPGALLDAPANATLKLNLVNHRLLDALNALWAGLRLQRELAGVTGE
jgi:HD-like signal output (HDOD) protein